MPAHTFHFLNVKNGDCSIIEHGSGHVSVIDVCNARKPEKKKALTLNEFAVLQKSAAVIAEAAQAPKNYGQKAHPENPIEYLKKFGITEVFRFMLTHPDMDHMDGIKDFFQEFSPINFYDTDNEKEMHEDWSQSQYREEDWTFYASLRDDKPTTDPRRLTLFSGDRGIHRTKNWEGEPPGDAFNTLAPSSELVAGAIESDDYNDASYVVLYRSASGKILLSGDSHDNTWDHILEKHESAVKDIDLLIAPHHGRDSDRKYDFLDVLKPKMTFFGNAKAKDLAYAAWRSRGLEYVTNNMAGNIVVDCRPSDKKFMSYYVSNEEFAKDMNADTSYSKTFKAWFWKNVY